MSTYNYLSFPLSADMADFLRFPEGPRIGTEAPTGELVDARGGSGVQLNDYFKKGMTVIEFGSYT